jgi:hypothetical protein
MATERIFTTKRAAIAAIVVGLAVLLGYWLGWFGRPPQMTPDDEVYGTVDALFTAVNAHDEKQLGDCERRLRAFSGAGKLPGEASAYLDSVIKKAREGQWRPAAEQLYEFMKVQRR